MHILIDYRHTCTTLSTVPAPQLANPLPPIKTDIVIPMDGNGIGYVDIVKLIYFDIPSDRYTHQKHNNKQIF